MKNYKSGLPFFLSEDSRKEYRKLNDQYRELAHKINEGGADTAKTIAEKEKLLKATLNKYEAFTTALVNADFERYFKDKLGGNKDRIIADAKEILAAEDKAAFETDQQITRENIDAAERELKSQSLDGKLQPITIKQFNKIREKSENNYRNYSESLKYYLQYHLAALAEYCPQDAYSELEELIEQQAAAAYDKPPLDSEQERPLRVSTTSPKSLVSINDSASNFLFNPIRQADMLSEYGETDAGQIFFADINILTGKKGKKGKDKIDSLISVNYGDNLSFSKDGKQVVLNDYDRAVFSGIITILKSGTKYFTLRTLYGAMTGKEAEYSKIPPATERELLKALDKLTKTEVKLNYENEKENYTFTDENGNTLTILNFRENIISLGRTDLLLNGTLVKDAYEVQHKPKLLSYAEAKKQIISTPTAALELSGKGKKNTQEVIGLRQFLITEIARISSGKQSRHIKYDSIYERISYIKGIAELDKKQKQSTRQSTLEILGNFEVTGIIKAFKEVKQGKGYHHIEIIPAPKSKEKQ